MSENLAVLDRDHLSAMTGGDAALAAEVLEIFKEQTSMWERLLDPKLSAERWADAAHTMKGAALSIGAMRLARACEATERLGRGEKVSRTAAAVSINEIRAELLPALEAAAKVAYELAGSGSFVRSNEPNS